MKHIWTVPVLAGLVFSCISPEPEEPSKPSAAFSVELTASEHLQQVGGWTASDEVSMMDGKGTHVFSSSGNGEKASFSGETGGAATSRVYVFPASESYQMHGDSIAVEVTSAQVADNRNLLLSAAKVSMKTGAMHDAFCMVRFSLKEGCSNPLTITAPAGFPLSGDALVSFNSGGYISVKCGNGSPEVKLSPETGSFEAGKEYYFVTLPCGEVDSLAVNGINFKCGALSKGGTVNLGELDLAKKSEDTPGDGPDNPGGEDFEIPLVIIPTPDGNDFNWPFSSPTTGQISNSFTESQASFPKQVTDFITLDGGYVFKIYASFGIAKNNGGRQGLKFGDTAGDYLEIPAVPGYCLTQVRLIAGNKGSNGSLTVRSVDGSAVRGGTAESSFTTAGDSFTWTLYETKLNTPYRLVIGSGSTMIQQVHFHFSATPKEYVDPSVDFLEEGRDTIPDFSRVGYHYGDRAIPDIPVKMTLEAPADGADALEMIKNAIATVETPGAILLKAGTYNVSSSILIARDGVVLRGEGEGKTILYCTATTQISNVVQIGNSESRAIGSTKSEIIAKYVPCGQMWVPVREPSLFSVGQKVFVYRPATNEWLDAIHMREIYSTGSDGITQWTASGYSLYWERHITAIDGYKIYLDNPIVMGIGGFGISGTLCSGSWKRVSECGVENLTIDTRYDATVKSGKDFVDEQHAWSGVTVRAAQNCWVRNVTTKHIGYCSVDLATGAYKVTVEKCTGLEPVSLVDGSRRYAFHFSGSQACLIRDCSCDDDRHQYVCGARVPGPNVFYNCVATKTRSEAGPHQRWTTGVLYDNVKVAGALNIHDRANYGSGHGWTSANVVLYNCEAGSFVCQSPWVSARNWAIGCVGPHKAAARTYQDKLGARPDGEWISEGVHVSPSSLYLDQLERRHKDGIWLDK